MTETAISFEEPGELLNAPAGYLHNATLPLASLVMLLPILVLYEVGTRFLTTAALEGKNQQIVAFSKMQDFFRLCGAHGSYMPALAVLGGLLGSHIARGDKWVIEFKTLAGMVVESVLLGLPLLVLAYLFNRYCPVLQMGAKTLAGMGGFCTRQDQLIMDLGAGLYEEFVFRLALCSLISLIFKDLLQLNKRAVYPLMVLSSGLLFALYHYWSPAEQFDFRTFAFRTAAGIYFSIVFMFRGFGITASSHCAYDIIITLW